MPHFLKILTINRMCLAAPPFETSLNIPPINMEPSLGTKSFTRLPSTDLPKWRLNLFHTQKGIIRLN